MLGRELEEHLNIPQQYRSRTDKQYTYFISNSEKTPREYTDKDILAYELIFAAKDEGLQRPQIIEKLAEYAAKGLIDFYPTEKIKSIEQLQGKGKSNTTKTTEATTRKIETLKPSRTTSELQQQVGMLEERTQWLMKENDDLRYELEQLTEQVEKLESNKPIKKDKIILAGRWS